MEHGMGVDELLDELWGLLHPDMSPEVWRDAVKTLAQDCYVNLRAHNKQGIQSQTEEFLSKNPGFWPLFKKHARIAKVSGRKRYAVAAVIEDMRWDAEVKTRSKDYKISNNIRSRLARKLMDEDPSFEGFFVIRPLRRG